LELLATKLNGQEIGDGLLSCAVREAQMQFWRAPELAPGSTAPRAYAR
jgi:hypothetical protein